MRPSASRDSGGKSSRDRLPGFTSRARLRFESSPSVLGAHEASPPLARWRLWTSFEAESPSGDWTHNQMSPRRFRKQVPARSSEFRSPDPCHRGSAAEGPQLHGGTGHIAPDPSASGCRDQACPVGYSMHNPNSAKLLGWVRWVDRCWRDPKLQTRFLRRRAGPAHGTPRARLPDW